MKIGIVSKVHFTKNKITGRLRECELPIYYDYGVDDIGSCVDWLVAQGAWKEVKGSIQCPLGTLSRAKLIQEIEARGFPPQLRSATARAWARREEEIRIARVPKYR
jgi:hypothetical protein